MRVDRDTAERWRERGFSPPDVPASYWRGGAPSPDLASRPALVAGGRLWASRESHLDHSAAREHMDWRDQTGWKPDAQDKMAATYRPLPHAPEAWAHAARAGSGDLGAAAMARYPAMREEVRLAMTEGVSVSTETELGRYEAEQDALVAQGQEMAWHAEQAEVSRARRTLEAQRASSNTGSTRSLSRAAFDAVFPEDEVDHHDDS